MVFPKEWRRGKRVHSDGGGGRPEVGRGSETSTDSLGGGDDGGERRRWWLRKWWG